MYADVKIFIYKERTMIWILLIAFLALFHKEEFNNHLDKNGCVGGIKFAIFVYV